MTSKQLVQVQHSHGRYHCYLQLYNYYERTPMAQRYFPVIIVARKGRHVTCYRTTAYSQYVLA